MGAGGLRVWREGGGFQGSFRVCELYRRSGALFPGSRRRWKRCARRFHRRQEVDKAGRLPEGCKSLQDKEANLQARELTWT